MSIRHWKGEQHMRSQVFAVGDRVRFSPEFVRKIGANPLSTWVNARGAVIEVRDHARSAAPGDTVQWVNVRWTDGEVSAALAPNLAHAGGR